MADGVKVQIDFAGLEANLDQLAGPVRESLSRRMLVEGGVYLRDQAKQAAVRSDPPYNPSSRGSQAQGTLADSIYLAFDTTESSKEIFSYTVSWSDRKAWWGKLVEFGYWRTHEVHRDAQGNFYTDMSRPLPAPKWMPPRPFLRPTIDAHGGEAIMRMQNRGKQELPILLAEYMK